MCKSLSMFVGIGSPCPSPCPSLVVIPVPIPIIVNRGRVYVFVNVSGVRFSIRRSSVFIASVHHRFRPGVCCDVVNKSRAINMDNLRVDSVGFSDWLAVRRWYTFIAFILRRPFPSVSPATAVGCIRLSRSFRDVRFRVGICAGIL